MDNKGNWKSFTISDKMNILAHVDAHTDAGMCVEPASCLTLIVLAKRYYEEP
jgi:hypothetical protein